MIRIALICAAAGLFLVGCKHAYVGADYGRGVGYNSFGAHPPDIAASPPRRS